MKTKFIFETLFLKIASITEYVCQPQNQSTIRNQNMFHMLCRPSPYSFLQDDPNMNSSIVFDH